MFLKLLKNRDIFLLDLSGDLDLASSIQLKETVMKLIERKVERLIISLNNVGSINSAGLGALIYIYSTFMKLSLDLAITDVQDPVRVELEVSKLSKYLPLAANVREASALLGSGQT